MNGKGMKSLLYSVVIFSVLLICCNRTRDRNVISFSVPITNISNALSFMNRHLDMYKEVNYYIDENGLLRIDNHEVGILDSSFLKIQNLRSIGYSEIDQQLFETIVYLNNNGINSCFRHKNLDLIVYDYKPTDKNEFEDIRYLIYSDMDNNIILNKLNGYAYVLDKKESLTLIALID